LTGTNNTVTIRAALAGEGWLVLADTYYPGWAAWVDGERATVLRANGAFRAVKLEAGEHTVQFEYRPRSFVAGAVISGLSGAALAGLAGWDWRRRRAHGRAADAGSSGA
jgi:uncharacterized membrane protein YfhO